MSLESRLAAGETVCSAWSGVPDALTVEILAAQGFDAVTLDMQHGGHNEDSVLRSIVPVQRAGKPALVRIPVGRFDMASRALDMGAEAVIAPMVNSIEDAQRFAAAMKYPPVGERSWGPTYAFSAARQGRPRRMAAREQQAHHLLCDDRDARRRRHSGRHPGNARDRRDLPRPVGFLDRLDQRRPRQSDARGHDADGRRDRRPHPQGGQICRHLRHRSGDCRAVTSRWATSCSPWARSIR